MLSFPATANHLLTGKSYMEWGSFEVCACLEQGIPGDAGGEKPGGGGKRDAAVADAESGWG